MSVSITTPEVQTRDHRLGTVISFHGSASQLAEQSRKRQVKDLGRRFSQCSDCSQRVCESELYMIRNAAVITHAPIGCCMPEGLQITRRSALKARNKEPSDVQAICSNITVKDTVYGGVEKLRTAIDEAYKRFKPEAIFVQSSCAAGIVGDDIESVADEKEEELGIPIIPVYCEGFKSKTWSSGFDAMFHGILRKIVKPCVHKDENAVNVINFHGKDTFTPLLAKLNLHPNLVVPLCSIEELSHISEALCTTQICETLGSYIAAVLEEKFNVPQVRSNSPYGLAWTDEWVRALAKLSNREELGEQVIESEHKRIANELSELKEKLSGKKAYIYAGDSYSHIFANMAHEFGVEICGVASLHHDQVRDSNAEELNSLQQMVNGIGDIQNVTVCNRQPYLMIKVLKKYDIDILITRHISVGVMGTKIGIPSFRVTDPNEIMGYDGLLNFGRILLKVIEAKKFYKTIGKHNILPYSKWWLEHVNPYYFDN